jgi:hypothetical protein
MAKLAFLPFSIAGRLLAGLIAKKLFRLIWLRIDEEEAPQPEQRQVQGGKLALALAIEGAVFNLAKGLSDHTSRSAFALLSGSWPGEEQQEPTEPDPEPRVQS